MGNIFNVEAMVNKVEALQDMGQGAEETSAYVTQQANQAIYATFKQHLLDLLMNPGASIGLYYAVRKDIDLLNEKLVELGLPAYESDLEPFSGLVETILAEGKTHDDLVAEIDALGGLDGLAEKAEAEEVIDLNAINGDPEDRDPDAEYITTSQMMDLED